MRYEFHFGPDVYTKQFDLYWTQISKKAKTNMETYFAAAIIGIMFFVTRKDNWGYTLLGYSICCLVIGFTYFYIQDKDKKRKEFLLNRHLNIHFANKETIVWEFNNESVRIKDALADTTLKWPAIASHRVINNTLFLSYTDTIHHAYILGAEEVGMEEFKKIVAFVKEKVPTESK